MKKTLLSIFLAQLSLAPVLASESICSSSHERWDGKRCITIGAGAAVATGSGIYAVKKYSQVNSIEKQYTQRIFSQNSSSAGHHFRDPVNLTSQFTNGDRITISYILSEAENRQYHIQQMMDHAASARTSAATYGALALNAMKSVSEQTGTDAKGNPIYTTRMEPDYATRATYATLAANSLADSVNYDRKAEDARRGGAVPTYELKKVLDGKSETARLSTEFVQEKLHKGGQIVSIDRLPVDKFNQMKSMIGYGRAGLVGVAIGAGVVIGETLSGYAEEKIKEQKSAPRMGEWSQ